MRIIARLYLCRSGLVLGCGVWCLYGMLSVWIGRGVVGSILNLNLKYSLCISYIFVSIEAAP